MKTSNKLPKKIQKRIAERLKELREHKQITQAQAAKEIGVTVKTYREWEIGKYTKDNSTHYYPSIDAGNLLALSELYGVSVDYLLCRSDFISPENDFIGNYTGLSDNAINGLRLLHFPANYSILDSLQTSRYDIIALNIILEDFYNKMVETPDYKKFGDETDTLLNCIGQYIDSGFNTILINQNEKVSLYSSDEVAQAICSHKIMHLSKDLKEKYSLTIIGKRKENKERFTKLFNDYAKEAIQNAKS